MIVSVVWGKNSLIVEGQLKSQGSWKPIFVDTQYDFITVIDYYLGRQRIMKESLLLLALVLGTQLSALAQAGFTRTEYGESLAYGRNFYHDVKLISVTDGIALISTKEGEIKVPWASLPADFQKKHYTESLGTEEAKNAISKESERKQRIADLRKQIKDAEQAILNYRPLRVSGYYYDGYYYNGYNGAWIPARERQRQQKFINDKRNEINEMTQELRKLESASPK